MINETEEVVEILNWCVSAVTRGGRSQHSMRVTSDWLANPFETCTIRTASTVPNPTRLCRVAAGLGDFHENHARVAYLALTVWHSLYTSHLSVVTWGYL